MFSHSAAHGVALGAALLAATLTAATLAAPTKYPVFRNNCLLLLPQHCIDFMFNIIDEKNV
jgi:hypothetical protein